MSQILYRRVVTAVPPSRNLVSSFGHGILESMPRVTRSSPTPTPPAEAVPTLGTAPVSASPLAMPVGTAAVSVAKYYTGATSTGKVLGSKRTRGQSYASASELPLSPEFQADLSACERKD